jgi:hypothetical protein
MTCSSQRSSTSHNIRAPGAFVTVVASGCERSRSSASTLSVRLGRGEGDALFLARAVEVHGAIVWAPLRVRDEHLEVVRRVPVVVPIRDLQPGQPGPRPRVLVGRTVSVMESRSGGLSCRASQMDGAKSPAERFVGARTYSVNSGT